MKNVRTPISAAVGLMLMLGAFSFSSCGFVQDYLNGEWHADAQRTSDIRWGYFVSDVVYTAGLGLIVDFATGAIYKEAGEMAYYQDAEKMCEEAHQLASSADREDPQAALKEIKQHIEGCSECRTALSKHDEHEKRTASLQPSRTIHLNPHLAHTSSK